MVECVEEIGLEERTEELEFRWKEHLNIHASFTTLWVVMKEVKR